MKIFFLIFFLPLKLFAQDITGVWTGTLYNDTTKQYLKYELAISEYNGKLSGYSHTIFVIDGVENIGVKSIKIKKSGEDYLFEDDKLIYNNYPEPPAKGVKTYSKLELSEDDSAMILSGSWKTNTTKIYRSITGNISLKKKKEIQETLIVPKLENLGLAKSLSFMPYNNYSKDVTISNLQNVPKQNHDIQKSNLADGTELLDSTTKREGLPEQPFANTKDISSSPNDKALKSQENKEDQTKTANNNILIKEEKASSLQQHDNNQTPFADRGPLKKIVAASDKKESENDINTKDNELVQKSTAIVESTPVKNDVSKVTSANMVVNHADIREENNQTMPAKNLANNTPIKALDKTTVPNAAANISSRKIEAIQSVEINSDSLLLTLYDNGEIDGDTVSVLLNGKVIMPMQGLTANGINKTIYITPEMGDSIVLIMYAENLGSIPPNTGLLIVHDGDARHEIRFTGDLQKNSAIILRRKKKT